MVARIDRGQNGKFVDNPDILFLENNIAIAGFILDCVYKILDLTDDNDVLDTTLDIQRHAIMIQKRTRDYQAKRKAESNDKKLL